MSKEKLFPIAVIIVGLILTLPALLYGFPDTAPDSVIQVLWLTNFSEQLWAGDFYPRWLLGMNGGLGSPAFFYYAPIPYYLTSLLKPLFASEPHGWHQLGVSASLALIASGLSAYLWLKGTTDSTSALIAAIVYMVMPYHLAITLYNRGGFTEFWAFVWMPLILCSVNGIVRGHKFSVIGLAVSYALLIMTHLPTTLIFSLVPIGYAFFTADISRRFKALSITLGAMVVGIGLSAIYLLPAMMTQEFVFIQNMRVGGFYYENSFLFAELKLWREFTPKLSLMVLTMAGLAGCAFIMSRSNSNGVIKRESMFWLAVVALSIFMMTPLSKPVWQIVPVLQAIQFPWRFNSVLAVATTPLLALGIHSVNKASATLIYKVSGVALLLVMSWTVPTAMGALNAYSATKSEQEAAKRVEQLSRELAISRDAPEYRPKWVESKLGMIGLKPLLMKLSDSDGNLNKVNIVEGTGSVVINRWKPRDIRLQVSTPTGVSIMVSQFYYPGWTAYLPNESSYLDVEPSRPDGLITTTVPSGNHEVLLRLYRGRPEYAGQIISMISAAVTLLLSAWFGIYRNVKLEI